MGKEKTQFKKGVSGNPSGRPKADKTVRQFQETTYKDFISKLQLFGGMAKSELKQVVDDPSTAVFDLIFARILYDAMAGKSDARQVLLDRLWGKVKEMEATNTFFSEQEVLRQIPIKELIELAKKYKG